MKAKFHYTGPTGPDQTKSADFFGDPGLRPGSREKVRVGPVGSGLARVVEFSLNIAVQVTNQPGVTSGHSKPPATSHRIVNRSEKSQRPNNRKTNCHSNGSDRPRIAVFAQIDSSYSSGGADVHFMPNGPTRLSSALPEWHLDRFSRFAGLPVVTDRQTDRQTDHATWPDKTFEISSLATDVLS